MPSQEVCQPSGTVVATWKGTVPVWAIQCPVGAYWSTQTPSGDVSAYTYPLWLITQQDDETQWVVPTSDLTFP
jgi:hypothetical protein